MIKKTGPTKKDLAAMIRQVRAGDEAAIEFICTDDMAWIEHICKQVPESALVELEENGKEKLW